MTDMDHLQEIARLRLALQWYADKVDGCRKITPEGDIARRKLNDDGGKLAREALGQGS